MKKFVSLILIFLMLAALCGCEAPIANDYVRGYKAKVDNDITFVYTQGAFYPDTGYLVNHYYEKELTYKEFAEVYGNKIIHESVRDDEIYYYTVYFGDNNDVYYLFLEKNENGEFYFEKDKVNWIWANLYQMEYYDSEGIYTTDEAKSLLLEKDLPENLLEGRLPYNADPNYITGNNIFKSSLYAWSEYDARLALYSIDRGMNRVKDNVTSFYRVLHSVAFDYTNDKGHEMCGALYLYEITVYADGKGSLRFAHIDEIAPRDNLPPNQDETVELTETEVNNFLKVIEERNFYSLPTNNPEESVGLDGYTTYVFGDNGEKTHLIKHWVASERYDIYHIRKAVEELTKSKIDVKYGGVYIDYGYNY